jgi:hypothetical protein
MITIVNASDFEFAVATWDGSVFVVMSAKHYPEYNGHLGEFVAPFWPKDMIMDETLELTFAIDEELSEEQVKEKLIAAGFEFSQDFQDALDEDMVC